MALLITTFGKIGCKPKPGPATVALDGQAQAGHASDDAGVAGGDDGHLPCLDEPLGRVDTGHRAALAADAGHLAVLEDIDPLRVGRAREAPGHRVVARDAAAALQRCAEHR
jgi:hypothetical protein